MIACCGRPLRWSRVGFLVCLFLLSLACGGVAVTSVAADGTNSSSSGEQSSAEPLVATWVDLQGGVASSDEDGKPAARCDHAFFSLRGRSARRNVAVPSSVASGATDPYAHTLWMFAGHEDPAYNDSWLLDMAAEPLPRWTKMNNLQPLGGEGVAGEASWASAIAFVPGALPGPVPFEDGSPNPADPLPGGLTALIFGGIDGDNHCYGHVRTLSFGDDTLRELLPQPETVSDSVPFPRAYTQFLALPVGFGSGAPIASDAADSNCFYMIGGMGPADGVPNSQLDRDWSDEWIFNATSRTWSQLGEKEQQNCTSLVTVCEDSITMDSLLTTWSSTDLTEAQRPGNLSALFTTLENEINAHGPELSAMVNDDSTCQQVCTEYETVEPDPSAPVRVKPPPLEGVRMARIGGKAYAFGGYRCSEFGIQERGGNDCFLDSMFILDIASMTWSSVSPPSSDPSDPRASVAPYWPSRRCYNTLVAHQERGLVIVHAGFFQDSTGVGYYYSDTFAFDVVLGDFVPLEVRGTPPSLHWSGGAALMGDDMVLYGGCREALFFDQLLVLRLGVAVRAANCHATGEGLYNAIAGQTATFYIQTRERLDLVSGGVTTTINSNSNVSWGSNQTFGAGLARSFSVQVVTSFAGGGVGLLQADVADLGAGAYKVSYVAKSGRDFQIFALLDGEELVGSPFSMRLRAASTPAPSKCTAAGVGASLAEKGKHATLVLNVADQFGNAFDSDSFLDANATSSARRRMLGLTDSTQESASENGVWPPGALSGTGFALQVFLGGADAILLDAVEKFFVTNHANGSLSVRYPTPKAGHSFLLSVRARAPSASSGGAAQPFADIAGSPLTVTNLNSVVVPEGLVIAFWFLSALIMLVCLVCGALVFIFRSEVVMRSSSPTFLYFLVLGSCLSSLSVGFLSLEGSDGACRAFHTLLTVGLVLSLSSLLVKSERVSRIFNARLLKVHSNLTDGRLLVPVLAATSLMLFFNLLWMGLEPVRSVSLPAEGHPEVLSFRTCMGGSNGSAWVGAILTFVGVILLYGVYLAVKTAGVVEQFNESKLIAASSYNLFFCCIIIVPLCYFLGDKSSFLVGKLILQGGGILWCSAFNVVALIGPKILLLWRLHHGVGVTGAGLGGGGGGVGGAGTTKLHTHTNDTTYASSLPTPPLQSPQGQPLSQGGGGAVEMVQQNGRSPLSGLGAPTRGNNNNNLRTVTVARASGGSQGIAVPGVIASVNPSTPLDSPSRPTATTTSLDHPPGSSGPLTPGTSTPFPAATNPHTRDASGGGGTSATLYDASTRRKTATSASTTNNGSAPRCPPAFVAEHARKLGRATSSATIAPQTHQAGAASPSSVHQPQSSVAGSPPTVTSTISASSFGNFFKIEQETGEATGGAAGGAASLALPHSALSTTDAGPVLLTSPQHYQYVYEGGQSDANNHLSMPAPLSGATDSGSGNGNGPRGRNNNNGGAESEGHSVSGSQVLPPTRSSLSQSSSGGTNASIPVGGSSGGGFLPGPGAAIGASTHSSGAVVVTTAVALGKHRVNIHHAAPGSTKR